MPAIIQTKYPGNVDIDRDLLIAVNNWSVPLATNVLPGDTTIQLAASPILVQLQPVHGLVSIGSEVIAYASITGNTLQDCTRGFDGTASVPHAAGTQVELRWVARHHNLLSEAIRSIQSTLGILPQGGYNDVRARLDAHLPVNQAFPSPVTDWSFTHNKRRLAGIQLWRQTGADTFEQFTAAIVQEVDTVGLSQVTITLTVPAAGYAVVL